MGVGIIIWVQEVQVLWITEVLSEVLEAEVQVVLVLGVVIVVVTKTNVGGSKQDKIDLTTSYFRYFNSIHEFNQQLLSMIHQFPASFWKNLHFILFFFLQFMCTTIYTTVLHATICKKNMFYFYCSRTETPVLIMP